MGEKQGLVDFTMEFIERYLEMCHPLYGLETKKMQCLNKSIKAGIIFLIKFGSLNESTLSILQKGSALTKLLCKSNNISLISSIL